MSTDTARTVPAVIGFSIVLSVVLFFRFYNLPEWLIFSTDQGRAMLAGRDILLGDFVLQGPATSVAGISLGPLYYYLTAVALWFSNFHPIGPAVMVAGMSVFTTAFLYLYVWRNWQNQILAVVSGLLYALSPLVTWQARIAIEPSPLPLIVIAWLWSMTEAVQGNNRRWWMAAALLPVLGIQFNFSAAVLWAAQAVIWLLFTDSIDRVWKQRIIGTGIFLSGLLLLVRAVRGTTSFAYWTREWLLATFPQTPFAATLLFVIFASTLVFWCLHLWDRWRAQLLPPIHETILLVWISLSMMAFTLKTVGGDHALAILFLAPAIVIPVGLQSLFRPRWQVFSLAGAIGFFGLWSLQAFSVLPELRGQTVADHLPVVESILELAQKEPYALVYRGHLDVYDAADDHYQYLLWYAGHPPAQSARIALEEPYFEKWLRTDTHMSSAVARTIYVYYPANALDRYEQEGTLHFSGPAVLDVVE
ncbi:glycosyltransferase family 39 protein [Candidatus Woesebacteria bacterium]|nr:glycosyltransferase family 39 protein [Candidatus Woesebacteria bacterium]MCD8506782.1 glycosyltransferase family 39 protein [Candidatus Woesebacteria bacterium]MCD8527690.1 glycosyltransferase family 39 protein [Candidatus Woesebacteria bacterium]MCD8546340.1 glycosyltransferase family 39 protein [Candidatus Woesebacteria bacterium]